MIKLNHFVEGINMSDYVETRFSMFYFEMNCKNYDRIVCRY